MRRVVSLVASPALTGGLVLAVAGPATAGPGTNVLERGERLTPGQSLVSSTARLVMQTDGNLVERIDGRAVWATHTEGRAGSTVTFQADGNLVVRSADGVARWTSGTAGRGGVTASLDPDGYFGVYPDSGGALWDNGVGMFRPPSVLRSGQTLTSATGSPSMRTADYRIQLTVENNGLSSYEWAHDYGTVLWEQDGRSGVHGSRAGQLSMQTDGNLVARGPDGAAYWSTQTFVRGSTFTVQSDGNFVVRGPDGRAVWSLGTSRVLLGAGEQVRAGTRFVSKYTYPGPSNYVVFQTDGNLVGRDGYGRVGWSTGTAGHPGSRLAMQTDGNLVIYGEDGRSVWSTGTSGCGSGVVFNTQRAAVETSHGTVWMAVGGRQAC